MPIRTAYGLLLPLGICFGTWTVAALHTREWRRSLLYATVAIAAGVAVSTELLSLFGAVEALPLSLVDLAWLAAVAGLVLRARRRGMTLTALPLPKVPLPALLPLVGYAVALGAIAVWGAPNNWDSMTYHMARVAHWADSGSVGYYATHVERQLFSQPLAEYAILHLQVLADSDRWANLVQLASMLVSLVMVTLVAANLGLGRRAQTAAVLVALTIPLGITESVTTQNDYAAALWVLCLAAVVTRQGCRRLDAREALLVGAITGLAGMTKATTYPYLAPLLLWWLLRRVPWRPRALALAVGLVAVVFVAFTAPGFARNLDTFGAPTGPSSADLVNDPIGPVATAENLYRHAFGQLGVPPDAINAKATSAARRIADTVGLDLADPASTFPGQTFAIDFGTREDNAQGLAACVLFVAALVLLLVRRRSSDRLLLELALCAVIGAVLLDSYFRWNPWSARFLLPFFLLSAVVSGEALARIPRAVYAGVLTVLVLGSALFINGNDLRPLVGGTSVLTTAREAQYFAARPALREPYEQATSYVRSTGVHDVGWVGGLDDWEYPLWVLLNKDGHSATVRSVQVKGDTARYEKALPRVIICTASCETPADGSGWTQHRFDGVTVWSRV